jgi:5-deoxy-glucuronate isomerase
VCIRCEPLLFPGVLTAGVLALVRVVAMFDLTYLVADASSQTLVVSLYGDAFASGISPRQAIDAPAMIYTLTTLTTLALLGVALLFVKPTQFVVRVNTARWGAPMNLKTHYDATPGYTQLVTPGAQPVRHLDFGILRLERGQSYESTSGGHEVGLVILSGICEVRVDDQVFDELGGRETVFDGRATGVYAPCGSQVTIRATSANVEIAVCRCATATRHPVRVVRPEDVVAHEVGGPGFRRYVHDILGTTMEASSMIVGETFTVAGNWSSFPPHKHDVEAPPDEVSQEELYLYKIRPAEGFGVQYLYSRPDSPHGPLDEALPLHEDDVTFMPFGYHPVAAPPGYDVYYLWFLAGETRLLRPHDDPVHAWIKDRPAENRSYPR